MIGMIISLIVLVILLVVLVYIQDRCRESAAVAFLGCIGLVVFTLAASQMKRDKNGITSTSAPIITYEVTNKVVDGEVVKSDTLYTILINKEEK